MTSTTTHNRAWLTLPSVAALVLRRAGEAVAGEPVTW